MQLSYCLYSQREIYRDEFILEEIDAENGTVSFNGGLTLSVGDSQGEFKEDAQKFQIERTVKWHFERAKKLHPLGIKVLSLFFIDKVANYRSADGQTKAKFTQWFEEAFNKFKAANPNLIAYGVDDVHRGYFSQDKKGGLKDTKGTAVDDEDTYSLIMKNKEELLDLSNPVQFIFSHSALREGWDNPNVFQICTLNESTSEVKKRQEVGRGLRLPVNNLGDRITDKKINLLTVIANESYEAFTRALQTEIEEDTGIKFTGKIGNANKAKVVVKLNKKELTRDNYPMLFELWDKISFKTNYALNYTEEELVSKATAFIKDRNFYPPVVNFSLHSSTAKINMSSEGLETQSATTLARRVERPKQSMPDVFGFLQSRVNVSRNAILTLLKDCERSTELMENPKRFLEHMVAVFERARNEILLKGGIKYERGTAWEESYSQQFFHDELGEVLADLVLEMKPEAIDKTPFNY